ncbi:(2Fe-2S)-binding protein [Thermosipho melanesiensis]|uniref:Pyridine nucleotide-disulfide oxidoreductase n=1 Tax=Thermosipho melanesiensis TaxID=46541 RepID=A0ABN4UT39_9BACT|nr:FAD-dependent oxidoreductase [Thermosipho melanesiensis]APT73343.1 pyridine nucleotide-disulfide oxidoreductase [Thermosipho melanesiensis]OOC38158.1 (2Fe-2S)-binding protein [Thermosipho melanesiensis]OOC40079.1 (2Fe-2S)-binding protein [Thermosipho melanesiensis]OOC40132.1 (2Fe-2S)-binding protein [Thermosipho melanesiensis]OOC44075.1 (2Fe-2S)-binding protein [Thermosipho melanesiensis]
MKVQTLIIGAGPAGLCGAIALAESNVDVLVVDEGIKPGGQLTKQTHKFFGHEKFFASVRGFEIGKILYNKAKKLGVKFLLQSTVSGIYEDTIVIYDRKNNVVKEVDADFLLIATGASEKFISFEKNYLPGVYGAGAVQTLIHQYRALPGVDFLIVGAGNIGLILAYQLIQANANVKAIIEISNKIGGYRVHANKIRRMGVPILLRHTILKAIGEERVRGAVVGRLNENDTVDETMEFAVDTICLSVGLQPSIELAAQAGVKIEYIPELGGFVPFRDENMKACERVYIAGDLAGIEEATTAMIEGYIAGYNIAQEITSKSFKNKINFYKNELKIFRSGPFASKIRNGLKKFGIHFEKLPYIEKFEKEEIKENKLHAVIECPQAIPCNPCETSCPTSAIKIGENINNVPMVDAQKCIGCGICVMKCPGLAIFLVQRLDDYSIVGIPYEFKLPEVKEEVELFNKDGNFLGKGTVLKIMKNDKGKTHVIFLKVPKGLEKEVRHFKRFVGKDDEIVCRCEGITRKEIEIAIDNGFKDFEELRRYLRISMGPCGGRTCRLQTLFILSKRLNIPISEIDMGTLRPPSIPLPFRAILKGVEKDV